MVRHSAIDDGVRVRVRQILDWEWERHLAERGQAPGPIGGQLGHCMVAIGQFWPARIDILVALIVRHGTILAP